MAQETTTKPKQIRTPDAGDVSRLKQSVQGEIILPGDAGYDTARHVHDLKFDKYPALIVRVRDADDVAQAVRFAAEHSLELAVRGGGHNSAGFGTVDDGLVIDLSLMRAVDIDAEARIARVQGGATAGEVTNTTFARGFVVPFGDTSSVGVGGITLGGGVGWLTRKWGMTIDSLVGAEIVTADGNTLHVSETEHPDLFWAIRGGGGNFGVVTTFEFRLHPLGTVLGGALFLPATRNAIRSLIELAKQAPDDLTTISMVMPIPPIPVLPSELHGKVALMITPVWVGDPEAGQRALAPFRAIAEPLADMLGPMPFVAMYQLNAEAAVPSASTSTGLTADALDDAAIDAILKHLEPENRPVAQTLTAVQIRVLGGAMARVPADATAYAHRDTSLMVGIAAVGFEEKDYDAHHAWVESVYEAIKHVATGAYVNFLEVEGEARIRQAYPPATYARLTEIKKRYDPHNLFHLNQNIPPA